jgi:hypothetical protein
MLLVAVLCLNGFIFVKNGGYFSGFNIECVFVLVGFA